MLVFDFDGVLVDSLPQAIVGVKGILASHGLDIKISDRRAYNRYWNSQFLETQGLSKSGSLKEKLRKAMLDQSSQYRLNERLLDYLSKVRPPMGIITSNFEAAVHTSLGKRCSAFCFIRGAESKSKELLLEDLTGVGKALYITDTGNDIVLCHKYGIQSCGLSWAGSFHSRVEIKKANPSFFAGSVPALLRILEYYER